MSDVDVVTLVAQARAPIDGVADRDEVIAGLAAVARMSAWCEAQRAKWSRCLDARSEPTRVLRESQHCSGRDADQAVARSGTLQAVPAFADALELGAVTAGHVDVLTRAIAVLDQPGQQDQLVERANHLLSAASAVDADEFARVVRRETLDIQRRGDDGREARLARQRRAARLRSWVDRDSGMWRFAGSFDPVTGLALHERLQAEVQRMFGDHQPADAPADPGERQDHLRSRAFVSLTLGGGTHDVPTAQCGLFVVDVTQPLGDGHGGPAVDWGLPIEVPESVVHALLGGCVESGRADVVVVSNGIVLHAPGALNLGRNSRVANRAQRRALHALYRTCAIPGCNVGLRTCKIHHVVWWRHGGSTDLDNLLPVCEHHHHQIHDHGWVVTLGARRQLTVALPDGTVWSTGPPSRSGP
jgi:hypothetical protein